MNEGEEVQLGRAMIQCKGFGGLRNSSRWKHGIYSFRELRFFSGCTFTAHPLATSIPTAFCLCECAQMGP